MSRQGLTRVWSAAMGDGGVGSYFGDGSDGDLIVNANETYTLPVAEDIGQFVGNYVNGYIGPGAKLVPSSRNLGTILLFSGDLTIEGTISVDRCAPLQSSYENNAAMELHIVMCGGLVGGNGGKAGVGYRFERHYGSATDFSQSDDTSASPGEPGVGFIFGGAYGSGSGGSGNGRTQGGSTIERPPVGTTIPYVPSAGSVGQYGSGGSVSDKSGGGGPGGVGAIYVGNTKKAGTAGNAIGGGLLIIFVRGKLTIASTGLLTADGGDGANGISATWDAGRSDYNGEGAAVVGGGGAAGGGIIAIVHRGDYTNNGSVHANGGIGGSGKTATTPDSSGYSRETRTSTAGANGEAGTVLVTTLTDLLKTK